MILHLLAPGVGMGGSEGEPPPVGESVSGGRYGVRRPVTMYSFAVLPALYVLMELFRGR
jgi:hypothetical protein